MPAASPYFDHTYYDPTYFDDDTASGGHVGRAVLLPDDELAVALLLALEDEF